MKLKKMTKDYLKCNGFIEFSYLGNNFILKKMSIGSNNKLVINNGDWRIFNTITLPSEIHYEINTTSNFFPSAYDKLLKLNTNKIKILLLTGKRSTAFIHQSHIDLRLINPEDLVNGIHIVHINDFFKYINDYSLFTEFNDYIINEVN